MRDSKAAAVHQLAMGKIPIRLGQSELPVDLPANKCAVVGSGTADLDERAEPRPRNPLAIMVMKSRDEFLFRKVVSVLFPIRFLRGCL